MEMVTGRTKKVLYVDMDGVLVDFKSGIERLSEADRQEYEGHYDDAPVIFGRMDPQPGAVEAFVQLSTVYDTYILSTSPWKNPSAWSDKLRWVQRHLGDAAYKRLILTHHKDLNAGEALIDDNVRNGAGQFGGEFVPFDSGDPDWPSVVEHLLREAEVDRELAAEMTRKVREAALATEAEKVAEAAKAPALQEA
jgi:5'(3')-deoxyribonucleotidase